MSRPSNDNVIPRETKRSRPEDMERQAVDDAKLREFEANQRKQESRQSALESRQNQLEAANMHEYQLPPGYHAMSEAQKNQYFGTRLEDQLAGHFSSGKMAEYHEKTVGGKILHSIKEHKEAIEALHQAYIQMEYLQQYYEEQAMKAQAKHHKLEKHLAAMAAGQKVDKKHNEKLEAEYQALLKEAQKLEEKMELLKFDISVNEAALKEVTAAKGVVGKRITARAAVIAALKGPGGVAHLPAARKAMVAQRKAGIGAGYARHYSNINHNIRGAVLVPPALSRAMPNPPQFRSNDPESLQAAIDYLEDFFNQKGEFANSANHPLDQMINHSKNGEHDEASMLSDELVDLAVQMEVLREMKKVGPNRLLDANFQPTDHHHPDGHILPKGMQYHQFEENGPYYVLTDEQVALLGEGQEINKNDCQLLSDLADQHLANEQDFCFQPSVDQYVRGDIKDSEEEEVLEVDQKATREYRQELKQEQRADHAHYAELAEAEDKLTNTLQEKRSELRQTTQNLAQVKAKIETHPLHPNAPKQKPAPQAKKSPPATTMSNNNSKRTAPELKPNEQFKSDLEKLLEMIRVSERSKCPELQQKVIDKIDDFNSKHGKQFDVLAKNDPQLRDIRKRVDGVRDYFQYRLDRQQAQSVTQQKDHQIKPGWPFTQEQMYRDIEYANRMETTLSDNYNVGYSAGTNEAKLKAAEVEPRFHPVPQPQGTKTTQG